MLRPRKRLTKRDIKEDRFVTWVVRISGELQEHGRQLLIGGAALLLALIIAVSLTQYAKHRSRAVGELMTEVYLAGRQGRPSTEMQELYRQLVNEYGNTKTGSQALVALAQAELAGGHIDAAQQAFQQYIHDHKPDDPVLFYAAWTGFGICLEAQDHYTQAAEHYHTYAQQHPKSPYAPQALVDAARAYRLAGHPHRSKEILQRLLIEYPNSSAAFQARRQLKIL